MATLRTAINAKIAGLTAQIEEAKQWAANTIAPLQAELYAEQAKLVRFHPWLETEQDLVPEKIEANLRLSPKTVETVVR